MTSPTNGGVRDGRASRETERQRRLAAELGESLARLRRALEDTESALESERKRADEAVRRVEEVYSSTTWRLGDLVLWIPKKLKGLVRR